MSAVPDTDTAGIERSEPKWSERNGRYLGASLRWLRLRLRRLEAPSAPPEAPPPSTNGRAPWLARIFGRANGGLDERASPPPPSRARARDLDRVLQEAAAEREELSRSDPPPALVLLAERLGLSAFERDTLLLCAAPEFDSAFPELCARVQGAARSHPTFALAMQALEDPSWEALAPHRPLRYARLLEINQPGATPLSSAALRADERIVNYVKGLNVLDERVAALVEPASDPVPLSASQAAVADEALHLVRTVADEGAIPFVRLVGRDAASRLSVAARVCEALGRRLYRLPLEGLPTAKHELEALARLVQRESLLLSMALYVEAESGDAAHGDSASALAHFLARDVGLVLVGTREDSGPASSAPISLEVPLPEAGELRDAWRASLGAAGVPDGEADGSARLLAGHFRLNLGEVQRIARVAAGRDPSAPPSATRIWDACRDLSLSRLESLAQRLDPKATWDDLVLGEEPHRLLRQIVAQVRNRHRVYEEWGFARRMNRGLGISALFTGESGTGKTMAAEVLASELRLRLYRIDLSAVVSKYIGETEKNLRKVFDAAEAGGAILFFDEADALFGKRSEVKDSHDRYANIEINYLLQRMEGFSGLAILATNAKNALDPAFLRRLRFVVAFAYPGVAERTQLWRKAFPDGVPRDAIDPERLARFGLSGGNIHTIALNAAFMAAERDVPLAMSHLLSATRTELRKLEKPVNEAEFR